MIIKGNSVGHPLPDPRKGLEMHGGINMNGQALKGLNAPVADDEAANKGYVDGNKVDKSSVVNNFTTTEEGFVADARALKVLNDSKLSMDLLWENASPTSDFGAQSIRFQLNSGDVLFIRAMSWGQYRDFIIVVVEDERKLFLLGDFMATAEHRLCAISKTGIDFGDVANDTHKNIIVPTQIYRFKGGSA